jgi:D-glutamate cyclase
VSVEATTTLEPFENLDRIITVELRPPSLPQGYVPRLYAAVRRDSEPLVHRIGAALAALEPGRVAICTGVLAPPHLPIAEMDGPVGAVVLGAALSRLGHEVEIVVEPEQVAAVRALCEEASAADVAVRGSGDAFGDDVVAYAATLDAAISIEKLSQNAEGVRHSVLGSPLEAMDARTDLVFTELRRLGRPTFGIGDGGNEIGFGAITDQVREVLSASAECDCGCAGGIVAATATDYLLPCAVSNVGAYALTAALALHLGRPELAPDAAMIGALLQRGVDSGLLDGGTLDPSFVGDDGVPGTAICAIVTLLSTIVEQQSRRLPKRPF